MTQRETTFSLPPPFREAQALLRHMVATGSSPAEIRRLIGVPNSLREAIATDWSGFNDDDRHFLSCVGRVIDFRDQVLIAFDALIAQHGYACPPAPQAPAPVEEEDERSLTHSALALFKENW